MRSAAQSRFLELDERLHIYSHEWQMELQKLDKEWKIRKGDIPELDTGSLRQLAPFANDGIIYDCRISLQE